MNIAESINDVRKLADKVGGPIELIDIVRAMSWPAGSPQDTGQPLKSTARKRSPRKAKPEPQAVGESTAPAKQAAKTPKPGTKAPGEKRQRASNAETEALKAKVWEYIKDMAPSVECSSGTIASAIYEKRTDVARMLKKLVRDGKVTVHGERRNARYRVVEA